MPQLRVRRTWLGWLALAGTWGCLGQAKEAGAEALSRALLSGDASWFERVSKPELVRLNQGGAFSRIQELCVANGDKAALYLAALGGGLKNRDAAPVAARELLYLDPSPLFATAQGQALARSILEAIPKAPGVDERTRDELLARFAPPGMPVTPQGGAVSWRQLLDDRRQVRVSAIGERRATAYTMTNLIVRHKHRLLFTWQDQPITNALGRCDEDGSQARVLCVLGLPSDDHGNAALALDTQGRLHALIGAHHGPLLHRVCDDPEKPHAWRDVAELGAKATHPSLVCDRRGTLHLTYRSSVNNPWTLDYQRLEPNGAWSEPVSLVRAAKTWYVSWTNTLAVAPDNTLHLVFSVNRVQGRGDAYFGAAHLFSTDAGRTWQQYEGSPLKPPADAGSLKTLEPAAEAAARTMPGERYARLKGTPVEKLGTTLQMLLSNAVVDAQGRPWVVLHNGLAKSAELYCAEHGRWAARSDLLKAVQAVLPGWAISEQSALSRHSDGTLEAVLMVVPLKGRAPLEFMGWQSNDLELLRVLFDAEGRTLGAKLVRPADPEKATWLPSLEKWDWNHPFDHPALLYSTGVSESAYYESRERKKKAKAAASMEVWLDLAR